MPTHRRRGADRCPHDRLQSLDHATRTSPRTPRLDRPAHRAQPVRADRRFGRHRTVRHLRDGAPVPGPVRRGDRHGRRHRVRADGPAVAPTQEVPAAAARGVHLPAAVLRGATAVRRAARPRPPDRPGIVHRLPLRGLGQARHSPVRVGHVRDHLLDGRAGARGRCQRVDDHVVLRARPRRLHAVRHGLERAAQSALSRADAGRYAARGVGVDADAGPTVRAGRARRPRTGEPRRAADPSAGGPRRPVAGGARHHPGIAADEASATARRHAAGPARHARPPAGLRARRRDAGRASGPRAGPRRAATDARPAGPRDRTGGRLSADRSHARRLREPASPARDARLGDRRCASRRTRSSFAGDARARCRGSRRSHRRRDPASDRAGARRCRARPGAGASVLADVRQPHDLVDAAVHGAVALGRAAAAPRDPRRAGDRDGLERGVRRRA